MKIFILEDDPFRMELFRAYLKEHEIFHCETAEDAIATLGENSDFDLIFLDHDLGGEAFVDSANDNTGAAVARWLAKSEYPRSVSITIHSLNPDGQINMRDTLRRGDFRFTKIVPFTKIASVVRNENCSN